MDNEPAIGRDKLIAIIHQAYGFRPDDLRFLIRGWGGDCYLCEVRSGGRYFLKLHDPIVNSVYAASSRPFYLPLMNQLHTKGILPRIPHPVPTRDGALSLGIGPQELVITNYIEGEVVGFGELPEDIIIPIAEAVGVLHTSLPQLSFEHPHTEGFEIAFEPALSEIMASLETNSLGDRLVLQRLRDILVPRKADLFQVLRWLKQLQARVRSIEPQMVVCHTDLHGGNLMTDAQGDLYILDWENAMIAPREHDLIFFAGDSRIWDLFSPIYQRSCGSLDLDSDIMNFYHIRRELEDIADYLVRIIQGDGSSDRDQADLTELVEILDGLVRML